MKRDDIVRLAKEVADLHLKLVVATAGGVQAEVSAAFQALKAAKKRLTRASKFNK